VPETCTIVTCPLGGGLERVPAPTGVVDGSASSDDITESGTPLRPPSPRGTVTAAQQAGGAPGPTPALNSVTRVAIAVGVKPWSASAMSKTSNIARCPSSGGGS
jgi:hypothetical protein